MEKCRVLKSVAAGTVFYVLISFFFGTSGLLAERQMFEQKKDLVNYTNRIEKINNELKMEKLALQGDDEVIASYARKLGYVNNDEKLVKIKAYLSQNTNYNSTLAFLGSKQQHGLKATMWTPLVRREPKTIL